jgi:hypothetical protein
MAISTRISFTQIWGWPDDATIGPSLLFWRVGARSGFCPISESTMDLASRFASLAAWR